MMTGFHACQDKTIRSPKPEPEEMDRMIPLEDWIHPAESVVPLPARACGAEEIDPETGERIVVPEMDLVISHVVIRRTEEGTWVQPTIRNLCDEPVTDLFGILIRSDHPDDVGAMTLMGNIPPHGEVTLGHGIGVPTGEVYTLIVDWDDRIAESNEGNNRCRVRSTGDCL